LRVASSASTFHAPPPPPPDLHAECCAECCAELLSFEYAFPAITLSVFIRLTWGLQIARRFLCLYVPRYFSDDAYGVVDEFFEVFGVDAGSLFGHCVVMVRCSLGKRVGASGSPPPRNLHAECYAECCAEPLCSGYASLVITLSVFIRLTWGLKWQITYRTLYPPRFTLQPPNPASCPTLQPPNPCRVTRRDLRRDFMF
jgi:hypothetical protein